MSRLMTLAALGFVAAISVCTQTGEAYQVPPKPQSVLLVTAQLLEPRDYRNEFAMLRQVHPYFEAHCIVTNVSKSRQTIETMSCSWNENWRTNDKRIYCPGWECAKNAAVSITLAPGKSYEKVLPLSALPQAKGKALRFRIGFTPRFDFGRKPRAIVTWSAPLSLSVPK